MRSFLVSQKNILIKTLILITALFPLFFSPLNLAFADNESKTEYTTEPSLFSETDSTLMKTGKVAGLTALTGGLLYFNAWVAKEYPEVSGGSMVLFSPLVASNILNDWGNAALVAGVIGLGLFNLRDNDDDTASKNDRFRRTLYSLPLIAIAAKSADYFTGGTEKTSNEISAEFKINKSQEFLVLTLKF